MGIFTTNDRRRYLILFLTAGLTLFTAQSNIGAEENRPVESGSVFVINLWTEAVDIQYGDKPVFSFAGLGSRQPSAMVEIASLEPQTLYFKPSSQQAWRYFQNASGSPEKVYVLPYAVTIIRISPEGGVSILRAAKPQGEGAFVAFLNAGTNIIDTLGVIDNVLRPVAQTQSLAPASITTFVHLTPGSYAGSLNMRNSVSQTVGQEEGSIGFVNIRKADYYLVVAKQKDDSTAADSDESASSLAAAMDLSVWDLGPLSAENLPKTP